MILFNFLLIWLFLEYSEQYHTTTDDLLSQINIVMDQTCVANRIPTYHQFKYELENCENILKKNFVSLTQHISVNILINTFCSDSLVLCGDIIKRKLDPCLSHSQREYLKYHILSENAILEYICLHNAKALKEMTKVDLAKCALIGDSQPCEVIGKTSRATDHFDYYKEMNCWRQIEEAECLADVYELCLDQTVFNFVQNMSFYKLRATPCKKYLNKIEYDYYRNGVYLGKSFTFNVLVTVITFLFFSYSNT